MTNRPHKIRLVPFATMTKTPPKLDTTRVIESLITAGITALAILTTMGDRIEKLTAEVSTLSKSYAALSVDRAKLTAERQAQIDALTKWNEQQDVAIKQLQQQRGAK